MRLEIRRKKRSQVRQASSPCVHSEAIEQNLRANVLSATECSVVKAAGNLGYFSDGCAHSS